MNYVVGFLFCGNMVSLVKKAAPAWQRGKYNGVGGKIEAGETAVAAMVREFREETGVTIADSSWKWYCTLTCMDTEKMWEVFFFKSFVKHPIHLQGTNIEPVEWKAAHDLPGNVIPNLKWLVPLALDTTCTVPRASQQVIK